MPWALCRWTNCEKYTGPALIPKTPFDLNLISERYAFDVILRCKFAQDRSAPHHRLYWQVLDEVCKATGLWVTKEHLHVAIKLHLRMVEGITLLGNGGTRFEVKSINFNSMDQGEFRLFFKRAMLAIEESTGINTDDIIESIKKNSEEFKSLKKDAA